MSGSNALTIPRDPPVLVNPLAAMDAGTQSAGLVYDLRQKQANEAAGQAYQGAINQQTGEFDPNEFRRRLAASGPAAMAAGTALLNTQNISSDQLKQSLEKQKWINSTAGALLQAGDFSDAAMLGALHNGVAGHILTLPEAQAQLATMPPDAAGRQRWLQVHQDTSASFQEQMNQRFGTPFRENVGGQIVGGVQYQRGGGSLSTGSGALTTTLTPESAMQAGITYPATADDVKAGRAGSVGETVRVPGPDVIKRFGYGGLLPAGAQIETAPSGGGGGGRGGVVDNTGKPVSGANPPHLNVPGQPAAPAPYQGTGTGTAADTVPIYQPPAPGPRSSLEGGVHVASANALQVPTVGAPGPPSPLVPGDVNAIMAGMNRGRATPAPGTQVAGASFATGPGYDEQVTAKTSQDRLAADQTAAANYAANVFPQTQALAALGRGVTTAPGADVANMMKGWAGGIYRSLGGTGAFDSTKDFDEVHKWYNQIALGNPLAAGSDARLATTLAGNANTSIHELAGADMMKAGIALMRMNATASDQWVNNPAIRAQYGYYTNYLRDFNKTVDPRAFAWDMYNTAQKADLVADLEKHRSDPTYAQKLKDSLNMVRSSGYIGEIRAMPNAQ